MKLVIELDTTEPVLPGAALSGSVCVGRDGAPVRSLRIGLVYVERRAGAERIMLRAGERELAGGALSPGTRVAFCVRLPLHAPPSDEPERRWELRAWAEDVSATHEIRVVTHL